MFTVTSKITKAQTNFIEELQQSEVKTPLHTLNHTLTRLGRADSTIDADKMDHLNLYLLSYCNEYYPQYSQVWVRMARTYNLDYPLNFLYKLYDKVKSLN